MDYLYLIIYWEKELIDGFNFMSHLILDEFYLNNVH